MTCLLDFSSHYSSLQFLSLKMFSGMTEWTMSLGGLAACSWSPSAAMKMRMARKSRYSSKVSWYFMSRTSAKTWQAMRRRRTRSFRISASSMSQGRQQYFLNTSVGWLSANTHRFMVAQNPLSPYSSAGNSNSFVMICSCYSTLSYFLPISWKSRKSRLDRSPISLLSRLQTSSTVSYWVIRTILGCAWSRVITLMSIRRDAYFSFLSSSSFSQSWKRSLPSLISVPQRMVKASRSSFLVRVERLSLLRVTVCETLILRSQEVRATSQKLSGRLRQRRKKAGLRLMRGWLKRRWKIWQMVRLRASMVFDLWLLNQLLRMLSSCVIFSESWQCACISPTMHAIVEKRTCISFFTSRYFTSTMYSVYFAKDVEPISSVPSTVMQTNCPDSFVIPRSTPQSSSARPARRSSLPKVKVMKPSEWTVTMFRNILLSSSRRAKKDSSTGMLLRRRREGSSTTSRRSVSTTRVTGCGLGSRMRETAQSARYSRESAQMGRAGVANSRSSSLSFMRRMMRSTSLLTWVSIFLKAACTSRNCGQSACVRLVFLMISWKSISYRAMRKVGCSSSFSANLLVFPVYWRHTSATAFSRPSSCFMNFWAASALRMQSVQTLKKGMMVLRMGAQHCEWRQLSNCCWKRARMFSWRVRISTIDENSRRISSRESSSSRSIGSLMFVMYSVSP